MTNIVEGILEATNVNKGGYAGYKVDGKWYNGGKGEPKAKAGDRVKFATIQKGNFVNVDEKKFKVLEEGAAPPPAKKSWGGKGGGYASKGSTARDDYWTQKDVYDKEVREPRISRNAAYNAATAFASLALANGALDFGKAKPADKLGILEEFVDAQADRLYARFQGADSPAQPGSTDAVEADETDDVNGDREEAGDDGEWE